MFEMHLIAQTFIAKMFLRQQKKNAVCLCFSNMFYSTQGFLTSIGSTVWLKRTNLTVRRSTESAAIQQRIRKMCVFLLEAGLLYVENISCPLFRPSSLT